MSSLAVLRRLAAGAALAASTIVAACGSGTEPAIGDRPAVPARPRPNIVVIMADDLGYGDLSSYDGWIETPALDALAAEGLRLTDFHSSGAVCSPTRAGLLTGRYQQRAGIPNVIYANPDWNRHHGLQPRETTIAERMQAEGYATGIVGKWHLGYRVETNPLRHGFDVFRGYVSGNVDYFSHVDGFGNHDWWDGETNREEPGYVTHLINEHAVAFIEEQAATDAPFFLYVAHEAPHFPYQGPDDAAFRVVGERIPETREPEQVRRAYREMVEEMDTGIGAILDTLRRLGLAERTFVFFLSDNGATPAGSNGAAARLQDQPVGRGAPRPGPGVVARRHRRGGNDRRHHDQHRPGRHRARRRRRPAAGGSPARRRQSAAAPARRPRAGGSRRCSGPTSRPAGRSSSSPCGRGAGS